MKTKPKLYHYVHCPYCIRVRMALGYLNVDHESQVLAYEDEQTPLSLTGKKMLPALTLGEKTINESLDIIKLIDEGAQLNRATEATIFELDKFLDKLGTEIHNLSMNMFPYTPEFSEKSRAYFLEKKQAKRGPFETLRANQTQHLAVVEGRLVGIEKKLKPFYDSSSFGILDIMLASHLWSLYLVPEFQFTPKIHAYLQEIKRLTRFQYLWDGQGNWLRP